MPIRSRVPFALALALIASPVAARLDDRTQALDAATRDLCDRRLALLGETGNHGSGETLAFKAALVERLVTRCGYSAIAFEAGIYDLLELERRRRSYEDAGPALLASAIGRLWSGDREFQPLLAFLDRRAASRGLTIAGLDPNVGSAGAFYSLDRMSADLTRDLPGTRGPACRDALRRRIYWDYPADRRYAASDKAAIIDCFAAIARVQTTRPGDPRLRAERRRMVVNLRYAIDADFAAPEQGLRIRAAAMYDNLRWHLARLPTGTKTIVWTATVHAARSTVMDDGWGGVDDLGAKVARAYGNRAFVLGFAAAGGRYREGRRNPIRTIAPAPLGSLESEALGADRTVAYLGRTALARLGTRTAAPFMLDRRTLARWRDALDGIVVFRTERPPEPLTPGP